MTEPSKVAIQLLDGRLKRHLQPLALVLMYEDRFSLLPELYEVFGEDVIIKFLDVFAGRVVEVPGRDVLERRFRAIRIWAVLSANHGAGEELALEYGVSLSQIQSIFRETRERLLELNVHGST